MVNYRMPDLNPKSSMLRQHIQKWLAAWIALLSAGISTSLIQAYGDLFCDSVHNALGNKLMVQALALLVCISGYLSFELFCRERSKLRHRRGLYWAAGDPVPYCPFCFDGSQKRVHLFTSIYNKNPKAQVFECQECNRDYSAWDGENFTPRFSKFRRITSSA